MRVIVISSPKDFDGEHEMIHRLFEEGLENFHLRKPGHSSSRMRNFLKKIDTKYLDRIVIHSNHHLSVPFKLRGVHVRERSRKRNKILGWLTMKYVKFRRPDIQISTSFHVIGDLLKFNQVFKYVFLSPVFDSISKVGHKKTFNYDTLTDVLGKTKYEAIALGGVDKDVLEKVKQFGFKGFALLGSVWKGNDPVGEFKQITEKWKLIESTP